MTLCPVQCQERSEFYAMVDLSKVPVLYTPTPGHQSQATILGTSLPVTVQPPIDLISGLQQPAIAGGGSVPPGAGTSSGTPVSILKTSSAVVGVGGQEVRRKVVPPLDSRMVVYVRQENEEIYTPLHLVPPTVPGLARAIESKYNVSATAIR